MIRLLLALSAARSFWMRITMEQIKMIENALPAIQPLSRRYDVDWLRTIALGLLIVYHVAISFQPWASLIFFPRNENSLESLWMFMAIINVWRIPLLFLVSGMGVRFALERRNWKQLLGERTLRILVPFIFGFFFVCPISIYLMVQRNTGQSVYIPNPGHLWFLANIYLYVLLLLPFMICLKKRPGYRLLRLLSKWLRRPLFLLLLGLPLLAEAWLVNPTPFTLYAMTPHGFWLGMVCFFLGYLFVTLKEVFWGAVAGVRRVALAGAVALYLLRLLVFELEKEPNLMMAAESFCWILAILGYGALYLNHPSRSLSYLSQAVFPVYIVHMPLQFAIAYFLLPLALPALVKFALLLAGTLGLSLLLYERVLRRLKWIRPLFGIKYRQENGALLSVPRDPANLVT